MPMPVSIRLSRYSWQSTFYSAEGRSLCSTELRKVFYIPKSTTEIWLIPHKHPGKHRIKITIKGNSIYTDKENRNIYWKWLYTATMWIRTGYSYISIDYATEDS